MKVVGVEDMTEAEVMTGMEDMTEVEDMTGMEVMTGIKNDVRKDKKGITKTPVT